ncbi:MAG: 16S rRNA processing protein RimM [Clostridia bacterium]|nr:16S rRNA processing protein RimM [Clostridia bacterium]
MDMINIAKITKPQGVKGEVKAQPFLGGTDVHFLTKQKSLYIDGIERKIESCSYRVGYLFIKLSDVNNRNDAELLRDKVITFPRSKMPPLDVNEFYTDDLIGCTILDEFDKRIGKIADIKDYGATSILVIKDGTEEILCPFLMDLFTEINIEYATLIVDRQKFDEVTKYED